tara:strand:- start:11928 stop:14117 length:2190 start_codon:yes stop_codon:yes gene_type:complete
VADRLINAQITNLAKAINALKEQLHVDSDTNKSNLTELTEIVSDLNAEYKELVDTQADAKDIQAAETKVKEAYLEQEREHLRVLERTKDAKKEDIEASREIIAGLKKDLRARKKATKAQEDYADAVASTTDNLGEMLGITNRTNTGLIKNIKAITKSAEATKSFGESLQKTFSGANIAIGTGLKSIQALAVGFGAAFSETDEGLASLSKLTGMSAKLGSAITTAAAGVREYGVTVTDIAHAQNELMRSIPLSELKDQGVEVSKQFATWQKFGVGVGASTQAFTALVRSFKRSDEDALSLQKRIMNLGDELGIGAPKMMESFAQAAPRLSIYGNQVEKVFANMATASAKLGLEVEDVMSLAEGFQTFEGSAKAAGQLNSILGSGLIDNIELMNASFEDPAKAALMIKNAFKDAGQTVQTLGPAGVKAAAAAAGFSDVGKFTAFLNGTLSAAELTGKEQLDNEKETLKAAQESMSFLDDLKAASVKYFHEMTEKWLPKVINGFKSLSTGFKAAVMLVGPILGTAIVGGIMNAIGGRFATNVGRTIASQMRMGQSISGQANPLAPRRQFNSNNAGQFSNLTLQNNSSRAPRMSNMKVAGMGLGGALVGGAIGAATSGSAAAAGSAFGGAIGSLGYLAGPWAMVLGPLGQAAGAAIGGIAGKWIGETFKDEKKKVDSSMPTKKTPTDVRLDTLTDNIAALAKKSQDMKVKLEVDEYAYKKGFKLSTAEVVSGG